MRICVVSETYWPEVNSTAITLQQLVLGLAGNNHQIQLVCPPQVETDLSKLPENIHYQTINCFAIPGVKQRILALPSRNMFFRLWQKQRPDVILISTEGLLGWSAVTEANHQKIPVVSSFHANFNKFNQDYTTNFLKKFISRYLVNLHNKTNTTLVTTDGRKQQLIRMGITNVSILGRGVDTNLFSPEKRNDSLREQWGVSKSDPVLLYVGRIDTDKNIDLALRTYFVLHGMNKRLKFFLVGNGALVKTLKNNHPNFIFAGVQTAENLATYYASSDLFVFPSITETYGNGILEAMASGLGIIAYDYAASSIHIKSGQTGLLANKNDSQRFIMNAKKLLRNELLLKNCRINACSYAQTQNWNGIVNHLENILSSAINFSAANREIKNQSLKYSNNIM